MRCPSCGSDVPPEPIVLVLTLCPACLASVVLTGGTLRRATGADTVPLSDEQIQTLKAARKRLREAKG